MVVFFLKVLLTLFVITAHSVQTAITANVKAELISEVKSVQPGRPFWMGLKMTLGKGWHTYWKKSW